MDLLLSVEPWIRSGTFAVVTVALVVAAWRWPRRMPRPWTQWRANLALFALNTVMLRLLPAASLVALSGMAAALGWGAFNRLELGPALEFAAALLVLDLGMYVQHRVLHVVPWFWRLHAVHHADTGFDVTTGVRFHPGEMLVSLLIKVLVVLALGASAWAVLVFEVLLSSASLFTHSNLALPAAADRALRRFIVTPDMHRIHHGVGSAEHDRNFGFLLSCWDHLFDSYRQDPDRPHAEMRVGLEDFRDPDAQRLLHLLAQPFARPAPA